MERRLAWEGCWNARDLGGLRIAGGGLTRWGAVVRSDSPHGLQTWEPVLRHGIRTIVDLRTTTQCAASPVTPPAEIERIHVSIEEDLEADPDFVRWAQSGMLATPLYYPGFIQRFPQRIAHALRTVARAQSGGVLIHCVKGCDRTGLIALCLLRIAGVLEDDVVADYEMTESREHVAIQAVLDAHGATLRSSLLQTMQDLDLTLGGELGADDLRRLRQRLNPPGV